jgi:hypothetical protein
MTLSAVISCAAVKGSILPGSMPVIRRGAVATAPSPGRDIRQ